MIVYFDVDYTLFNNGRFRELMDPALARVAGVEVSQLQAASLAYSQSLDSFTDFEPDAYVTSLATAFHLDSDHQAQLKSTFWSAEIFAASLFDDVKPALTRLNERGVRLGIFSEAIESWQQKKLELLGIKSFFEQNLMLIERRKETPEAVTKLESGSWIVDDKPSVVTLLAEQPALHPVWLHRSTAKHQPTSAEQGVISTKAARVTSLTEFADLVLQAVS